MSKQPTITTKLPLGQSAQPEQDEHQKECLAEMNRYLKKLKIDQQWEHYDEIRLIGQPDRVLFYTVVGILFFGLYVFGATVRLFKQQSVVLQISAFILALVIKATLPKAFYTIQFASKEQKDKIEITKKDKERFQIVQEMYNYMREMDSSIRGKKIDDLKKKKKDN